MAMVSAPAARFFGVEMKFQPGRRVIAEASRAKATSAVSPAGTFTKVAFITSPVSRPSRKIRAPR